MRKLKTMTEAELIRFALNGIWHQQEYLQNIIQKKEDRGEDFHELENEWNVLENKYNELLKYT